MQAFIVVMLLMVLFSILGEMLAQHMGVTSFEGRVGISVLVSSVPSAIIADYFNLKLLAR